MLKWSKEFKDNMAEIRYRRGLANYESYHFKTSIKDLV